MPKKTYEDDMPKRVRPVVLRKKNVIKVIDDIVDIFEQEIIKHQILTRHIFNM